MPYTIFKYNYKILIKMKKFEIKNYLFKKNKKKKTYIL